MISPCLRSTADVVLTVGMMALLHGPQEVTVSFSDVPAPATSVTIAEWHEDEGPRLGRAQPLQGGRLAAISATAGRSAVLMFSRADGTYILDGPFTWPEAETTRTLDQRWRRTISAADTDGRGRLQWVSTTGWSDPWPRCAWDREDRWQCWGVPVDAAGVVISQDVDGVAWSVAMAGTKTAVARHRSRWGRLLHVRRPVATGATVDIKLRRPVAPPPQRLRSIRLDTADLRATAVHVSEDAVWVAGDESPPGAWIELSAGDVGPTLVPLRDVVAGQPALPLVISMTSPGEIRGTVVDAAGSPVASALVSLFRLIDPPETIESTARGEPRARRVGAGQVITASDGVFAFERLPEGDFDVVVWHGQLGRASRLVRRDAADLVVRLAPRAVVRGRVLVRGAPAADVPIVSVPDVSSVSASDDLTELKGGDGRTGPDGRFVVALADKGGGELRVGGNGAGVRRVRLPLGPAAGLDVGDLELPGPLAVTFVLDQDPGCGLVAVGPVGKTGLQVVSGRRTHPGIFVVLLPEEGSWRLTLSCGQLERTVVPALLTLSPTTPRTINLRVQ